MNKPTEDAKAYLDHLREKFGLALFHQTANQKTVFCLTKYKRHEVYACEVELPGLRVKNGPVHVLGPNDFRGAVSKRLIA
jgi:hypothetical protein